MFTTILYILIILSFVGLVIFVISKIPMLADLSNEEIAILSNKKGSIQKFREINFRQHFFKFIVKLEKFLRRLKIVFIKFENVLGKWIKGLSNLSRVMAHKSRAWIKHREMKRLKKKNGKSDKKPEKPETPKTPDDVELVSAGGDEEKEGIVIISHSEEETEETEEAEETKDVLPLSELEKPTKEEQKWIDLIIENPRNITAYKFLGLLYWKQHNYADAKASLEMAVKLGSRDKKVREIIKEIKEKDGGNIV